MSKAKQIQGQDPQMDRYSGRRRYETYISDWHYYLKGLQEKAAASEGPEMVKTLSMSVLTAFYVRPFRTDQDFYEQFYQRLEKERLNNK